MIFIEYKAKKPSADYYCNLSEEKQYPSLLLPQQKIKPESLKPSNHLLFVYLLIKAWVFCLSSWFKVAYNNKFIKLTQYLLA